MSHPTRRAAMAMVFAAELSLTVWPAVPVGADKRRLGADESEQVLSGKQL